MNSEDLMDHSKRFVYQLVPDRGSALTPRQEKTLLKGIEKHFRFKPTIISKEILHKELVANYESQNSKKLCLTCWCYCSRHQWLKHSQQNHKQITPKYFKNAESFLNTAKNARKFFDIRLSSGLRVRLVEAINPYREDTLIEAQIPFAYNNFGPSHSQDSYPNYFSLNHPNSHCSNGLMDRGQHQMIFSQNQPSYPPARELLSQAEDQSAKQALKSSFIGVKRGKDASGLTCSEELESSLNRNLDEPLEPLELNIDGKSSPPTSPKEAHGAQGQNQSDQKFPSSDFERSPSSLLEKQLRKTTPQDLRNGFGCKYMPLRDRPVQMMSLRSPIYSRLTPSAPPISPARGRKNEPIEIDGESPDDEYQSPEAPSLALTPIPPRTLSRSPHTWKDPAIDFQADCDDLFPENLHPPVRPFAFCHQQPGALSMLPEEENDQSKPSRRLCDYTRRPTYQLHSPNRQYQEEEEPLTRGEAAELIEQVLEDFQEKVKVIVEEKVAASVNEFRTSFEKQFEAFKAEMKKN